MKNTLSHFPEFRDPRTAHIRQLSLYKIEDPFLNWYPINGSTYHLIQWKDNLNLDEISRSLPFLDAQQIVEGKFPFQNATIELFSIFKIVLNLLISQSELRKHAWCIHRWSGKIKIKRGMINSSNSKRMTSVNKIHAYLVIFIKIFQIP